MLYDSYPFKLPPLPYPYDALEPYIDAETMHYHHDKHFQTYVTKLNEALAPCPELQTYTLVELLANPLALPAKIVTAILHNGGGVYNHYLYFSHLAPAAENGHQPTGVLLNLIEETFTSFDNFKKIFSEHALDVFGSGYTYLVQAADGVLEIVNLKNQETLVANGCKPIILVDVWEHAYYLKYKNARADYVNAIWNVIQFPTVSL